MPPFIALLLCLAGIVFLFRLDSTRIPDVSKALWIPLIWMLILGTRLPANWIGWTVVSQTEAFSEGNALDRLVYLALIILGVGVLISRRVSLLNLLKENIALSLLILLGLVSFTWSDFPYVAFKRWFRDFGGFVMIAVVLSESNLVESVATLLRRLCYVVIPLSIVLIRYYPTIGRGFESFTGAPLELGVTNNKNLLGVLCLSSALLFFWDTLRRWSNRSDRQTRQVLFINGIFLGMTAWLLYLARSSTSTLCVVIGCSFLALTHTRFIQQNPARLKVIIPVGLSFFFIFNWVFDMRSVVAPLVGREATLTGRTDLWKYLETVDINWLLGAGYESFWLGSRFEDAGAKFPWGPTQAHDGYREMYLNLGMLGLSLLIVFLFMSYRKICKRLTTDFSLASLGLALWIALLCYNVTEAAFKSVHVLWFSFLLASLSVPVLNTQRAHSSRMGVSRNSRSTSGIRPLSQFKSSGRRYS